MKLIRNFFELVKFEHTLFALPFAYMGGVLADGGSVFKWILVTLAMIGARTAGMSLNRLIDRKIDEKNPRTKNRILPSGKMKNSTVWLIVILSLVLFLWSAYLLNPLCFILSPTALILLFLYSYLKRFTYLCHIVLGIILGAAPVGGWIAMTGRLDIAPILLGVAVIFWTAGFDIIYACQDYQFDIKEKLFSIPTKFGVSKALIISEMFHVITILLIFYVGFILGLNLIYFMGVIIVAGLIAYEHYLVRPEKLNSIQRAFFVINSWVSVILLIFTLVSKMVNI
ncbi:MAG TPA: 4-hydroxybenzoate octaprenyltransferase [Lachnospiraceae bacterium]|nr:4-hydroxybenzoate octaprenyltransferase [Lachnospiraceae bacterium]